RNSRFLLNRESRNLCKKSWSKTDLLQRKIVLLLTSQTSLNQSILSMTTKRQFLWQTDRAIIDEQSILIFAIISYVIISNKEPSKLPIIPSERQLADFLTTTLVSTAYVSINGVFQRVLQTADSRRLRKRRGSHQGIFSPNS